MEDALSLNGDVRTTMIGADWARGPLTVGLSVGRTLGLGGYSGPSGGQMTKSMTGFYPWVGTIASWSFHIVLCIATGLQVIAPALVPGRAPRRAPAGRGPVPGNRA